MRNAVHCHRRCGCGAHAQRQVRRPVIRQPARAAFPQYLEANSSCSKKNIEKSQGLQGLRSPKQCASLAKPRNSPSGSVGGCPGAPTHNPPPARHPEGAGACGWGHEARTRGPLPFDRRRGRRARVGAPPGSARASRPARTTRRTPWGAVRDKIGLEGGAG